jgi:hypothetical protein
MNNIDWTIIEWALKQPIKKKTWKEIKIREEKIRKGDYPWGIKEMYTYK